ncbi:MAG: hypothetical protein WDN04_22555 [Rhodospirillales bacterium]
MPDIEVELVEIPCVTNVLGVKVRARRGPSAARRRSSTPSDALDGVVVDMPATPEVVWAACQRK